MGATVTIALPLGRAFETDAVIGMIARDYPSITASRTDDLLHLTSASHDAEWLAAIGWSAAASLAVTANASQLRSELMDYLLS